MENLKIRVTTAQESKEAQELLFELGYYWAYRNIGKKFHYAKGDIFIFADSSGILGTGAIEDADYFTSHNAKEIIPQQLKDMVVLKRNDVKDATHEDYQKNAWLLIGCDFYMMQDGEWELRGDAPELLKPIEKEMKEYLSKNSSGNYQLVNHRFSEDDIAVPEGAEILTIILGDKVFYKSVSPFQWFNEFDKKWLKCSDAVDRDVFDNALWKRQPITETEYLTQGKNGARLNESIEQLKNTAKTETLNDKVASAEVARQDNVNHPKHYTSDPSGIECIEITRHRNFNIGNAIKYLWRNGLKDSDSQIQDLEKAIWYIQDEIKRLSK